MTTARPSRSAKSASRKSCCSNGISTSSKITTTSANFTARKPSDTESFSSFSCTFALRRIPAVSKIRIGTAIPSVPDQSLRTEMASRVMPASGPVNKRSSPIILLIKVDLPAFGRPHTAICRGFSSVGTRNESSSSSSTSTSTSISGEFSFARSSKASDKGIKISYSSSIPTPCSAESRIGSPRPNENASR